MLSKKKSLSVVRGIKLSIIAHTRLLHRTAKEPQMGAKELHAATEPQVADLCSRLSAVSKYFCVNPGNSCHDR